MAVLTYAVVPKYPTGTNCFLCGRFGSGVSSTQIRRCARCQTSWDVSPLNAGIRREDAEHANVITRDRYYMRPLAWYADMFDDFIDHATVRMASPA